MRNLLAQAERPEMVENVATLKGLEAVFSNVLTLAIGLSGVALFIFVIKGAVDFITSGGDSKKAEGAKNTITYAIFGMVFVALAFLILRTISTITGVTGILNFQITVPSP